MSDTEKEIDDLVRNLATRNLARMQGYISHLRFPNFKGLQRNLRIDLKFPVTALVGPNGCGKSSVLHAMYGMPFKQSTSDFYFSTKLDPIEDRAKDQVRYIYGYWHAESQSIVEVRKIRVQNKNKDYEYFEPDGRTSKSADMDGMDPMPQTQFSGRSRDRWDGINKEVKYINSKLTIGAFERAMTFKPEGQKKPESHRLLLNAARKLHGVFSGSTRTHMGPKEAVLQNFALEKEEISVLARILSRPYSDVQCLSHMFFVGQKYGEFTARFSRKNQDSNFIYSDFLAGSGELCAVKIVHEIYSSVEGSLVLLDEPETCLHPGAQRELLNFLLTMAKAKNLQIVFTTHSPELIRKLPKSAVKVFQELTDGKFSVLQDVVPEVAFNRLGAIFGGNKLIFVEDALSKAIVESAVRFLDVAHHSIQVHFYGGGFEWLLGKFIPSNSERADILVLLDGDVQERKPFFKSIPSPSLLPQSDLTTTWLENAAGIAVYLPKNGGLGAAQNLGHEKALVSSYLSWCKRNLRFLPGDSPENIALTILKPGSAELNSAEAKNALNAFMKERDIKDSSELAGAIKQTCFTLTREHPVLKNVCDQIEGWINANQ